MWSVFRLLGFDKLLNFIVNEWLQDIKKNQLQSLLGGIGPMHAVVQLCKCRFISLMIQISKPEYECVSSCSEEYICKIWVSYSIVAEDSGLLGCDTSTLHVPGISKAHIAFKTLEVTYPLILCCFV